MYLKLLLGLVILTVIGLRIYLLTRPTLQSTTTVQSNTTSTGSIGLAGAFANIVDAFVPFKKTNK